MTSAVRTTCPYCGVGCGVLARADADRVEVSGDPEHPANGGRLCSKGSALGETLGSAGRLLRPRVDGRECDWDAALERVAGGLRDIIERYGPDAVAFYVSGQLLTEDYYVANKLMKGFIGTANIDTNSRLCMSSAVAAHKRAFGEDLVPVNYTDLELADLIVLVGSNTAWCHPVLYQRIVRAREQRPQMRIVVIDPRRTPSCDIADLHLPVRAGTDVWLFNGLLSWLARHEALDRPFIEAHTRGFGRALLTADNTASDPAAVARLCGVNVGDLLRFYQWFAATERTVTAFSQGVNQSTSGTDKANAIINCHLATGRIGQPGTGPFSITGQPNAMGGREVGGLANTLAAHMELEDAAHRERVQGFWASPRMAARPGLKAVDLFEAMYRGDIKAVWIMATNPVVSLPNADRAVAALKRCELVVVSDCIADTDTTVLAHVLLPAAAWGEKDGTVTNSDRHISRQRAFLPLPGEARPDWWIIGQVAKRMGYGSGFGFDSAAQIFDEHARLSACGNEGERAFDLGGLTGLDAAQYDALPPVQWPVRAAAGGVSCGTPRLFADRRFFHADGRARFIALRPRPPRYSLDQEYPLALNTGRIRDQWHTMTRTGRSARLSAHLPEPFVEVHPDDALSFSVREGHLARVRTRWGSLVARVRLCEDVRRGSLFVPIHWNGATASDARVGALVNPATDPVSGEPEFKYTPAHIAPFTVAWYGFALARAPLMTDGLTWWARVQSDDCLRYEMAGRAVPGDWAPQARRLLGDGEGDWIEYSDPAAAIYRAARLRDGQLEACLFIASRPELPSRDWLASLFASGPLSNRERAQLLSGRPPDAAADAGPTVCSCFRVGRNAIVAAIAAGCSDPRAIGACLKAGTNCGSCIPELRRLLLETSPRALPLAAAS
jgi:assimilatory nitrate reductase catalytic subunit